MIPVFLCCNNPMQMKCGNIEKNVTKVNIKETFIKSNKCIPFSNSRVCDSLKKPSSLTASKY